MNPAFSGTEGGLESVCLPLAGRKEIVKFEWRGFLEKAKQFQNFFYLRIFRDRKMAHNKMKIAKRL
jgi:hypothetical protein